MPRAKCLLTVWFFDTMHAIGLSLLFYGAFPQISTMTALVIDNSLYLIQTIVECIRYMKKPNGDGSFTFKCVSMTVINSLAISLQAVAMIVILIVFGQSNEWGHRKLWASLPMGLAFTLLGWWRLTFIEKSSLENSVPLECQNTSWVESTNNPLLHSMMSIWKIILFFGMLTAVSIYIGLLRNVDDLFSIFEGSENVFETTTVSPNFGLLTPT